MNRNLARAALAALSATAMLLACGKSEPTTTGDTAKGNQIAISVAPLSLPNVSDAEYTFEVYNQANELIWSRTLRSSQFGDSRGSVSYVGPCDGDSNPNRIELTLNGLWANGTPLVDGTDYANPARPGNPLVRTATCDPNADTAVVYDLTVARAAEQGFFDISVNFSNIFCSAKFDCQREVNGEAQNLTMLYNPHTGERDLTAVLGFACTAGPDTNTHLYMSKIKVICDGRTFYVDPETGPGNLDPPFPGPPPNQSELFFQTAVYRGEEQLANYNKAYWNVALGLNTDAFDTYAPCVVEANATAADFAFPDGNTTEGMHWPYVAWRVPLTNAGGDFVCTKYAVDSSAEVNVTYSTNDGVSFAGSYDRTSGNVTQYNCDPGPCGDCSSSCSTVASGGGDSVDGNSDGIPPLADELDTKEDPDDITGLVSGPNGGLTLADQNYDLPFIWIANSADDTMSKLNTETMQEVARYHVCNNPSRTAVDLNGDVFVACRDDGHVMKIAVIEPDCVDRNGDLVITTTRDTNGDGTIQAGEMVPKADDECILWEVAPDGNGACISSGTGPGCARAAGVDAANNVWIGMWSSRRLYRLDGTTGATLKMVPITDRPYGLAIADDGMIWVSSRDTNGALLKVDPTTTTNPGESGRWINPKSNGYGLAVGPYGRIWQATHDSRSVEIFDPASSTWVRSIGTSSYARGVAVRNTYDAAGDLLDSKVIVGQSTTAHHIEVIQNDANAANIASLADAATSGTDAVGVAVDAAGMYWAINYSSNSASRIDPDTYAVATKAVGTSPYTYSDMTGQALRNISGTEGRYRHTYQGWTTGNTRWYSLNLVASLPGATGDDDGTTSLTVRYRTAPDEATMMGYDTDEAWVTPAGNVVPPRTNLPMVLDVIAPWIEIEVQLDTSDPAYVPELTYVGLVVYHE